MEMEEELKSKLVRVFGENKEVLGDIDIETVTVEELENIIAKETGSLLTLKI